MAVQQIVAFQLNPGGREPFLSLLGQSKAASEAAGASVRVAAVMSGQRVGSIAVTTSFDSWDAAAQFAEATAESRPTQPIRDALASANPPATIVNRFHRTELLARDGAAADAPFLSNLSFDATANRAEVVAAIGETRDVFESLGSASQVWTVASGENAQRLTIVSAFDGEASYLRFRGALEARLAGGTPLPVASVTDHVQGAGILHTMAIDV